MLMGGLYDDYQIAGWHVREAVALSRDLTSSSRPLTGSADSTGYTPTGGAKVTTGAPNF
jgi:hypothetical protein